MAERPMHSIRLTSILHLIEFSPNYPQPPPTPPHPTPTPTPKKLVFRRKIDVESVKYKFVTLKHPPILDYAVKSE